MSLVPFRRKTCFRNFVILFILMMLSASKVSFASGPVLKSSFKENFLGSKDDSLRPKEKGNVYFGIGPLFLIESYKDYIVSSNTYTSLSPWPGIKFGLEKRYKKYSGYTYLVAASQNLNDAPGIVYGDDKTQLLTFRLNTSRAYYTRTLLNNKINWGLGYNVNAEYTHRLNEKFQNSAYTFDIWANAGIANRFEYHFAIKTERKILFMRLRQPEQYLMIGWQVNIPLAGVITRPNYAGIRHFANGAFLSNLYREMKNNAEFTSLHNFIMVQSQIELLTPLGNNNKLRIAYNWQGFSYNNKLARLQGVWGGLEVGLILKLDSRPVVMR